MKAQRILKGRVTLITSACGEITDYQGNQYFFNTTECVEGKAPELHSEVTFIRDRDYTHTLVATLVKPSILKAA